MNKISFPVKLAIALLLGMASISMLNISGNFPGQSIPLPGDATATEIEPFTNLNNLLVIEVEFYPSKKPVILSVTQLAEGRLTPKMDGNVNLQVQDKDGSVTYELAFTPKFVYGEPAIKHDSVRMRFIVPGDQNTAKIIVRSDAWNVEYKINGH